MKLEINQSGKQFEVSKPLYICDPYKNKSCKKTACYINGGECYRTYFKEYAKEDKNI